MRTKRAAEWTPEDLQGLIDAEVREDVGLDYKGEFDRNETLSKQVVGFANSMGGTLFLGIEEKRDENKKQTGVPVRLVGIPLRGTLDQEQLRFQLGDFDVDLKQAFRLAFDMVFQAAGLPGSPSYSDSGKWIR